MPPPQRTPAFVGRQRELDLLHTSLTEAVAGRGRLVMLTGEPGIGKTRLAEELAVHAAAQGVSVRWGRCWEGSGAPGFWPWIQILRSQLGETQPAVLRGQLGARAGGIARLVPDRQRYLPGVAPAPADEDAGARFRLFDSVTHFLKASADREPLALILEDLHWADAASLQLLRFFVDELQGARILLVATYRDIEVTPSHEFPVILGQLAYHPLVQRLELHGLSEAEIGTLVETLGQKRSASFVAQVHRLSGGNPFFATEIARAGDSGVTMPAGVLRSVSEVIANRLRGLPEECNGLLRIASVIGPEFEQRTLEAVSAAAGVCISVVPLLSGAVQAGIIDEVAGVVGGYRFAHALIREVLYAGLRLEERLRLHWEIAIALDALGGPQLGHDASAPAHHFLKAIAGCAEGAPRQVCIDKAVFYTTAAAEQATAMMAFEEAAIHYGRAVRALEAWAADDIQRQCELLLAQGEAQGRASASLAVRSKTLQHAAALARRLGRADLLARAAVNLGRYNSIFDAANEEGVALLHEALDTLGPHDSVLRARLLAFLAVATYFPDPRVHSVALSQEAVAMARRLGDSQAMYNALISRSMALAEPEQAAERTALATEILQLAERVDEQVGELRERAILGRLMLMSAAMERGEIDTVERDLAVFTRHAEDLRLPLYRSRAVAARALLALLAGRFAEVEQLTPEALRLMQPTENLTAADVCLYQLYWSHCEQGRLAEIEHLVKVSVERCPTVVGELGVLAHFYAEVGRPGDARAEIERLSPNDFKALPHHGGWLLQMALVADACATLGDTEHAEKLYTLLLPYGPHLVFDPTGMICLGSTSFFLGQLAGITGRREDALRHLDEAIDRNAQLGSRPWVANAQCASASVRIARNHPGDRQRAGALLSSARETAEELGMRRLERKARKLQEQLDVDGAGSAGDIEASSPPLLRKDMTEGHPASRPLIATLRNEGDYWVVGYEAATFRLKDRLGLHYLAVLLQNPGREFLAIDLVAAVQGEAGAEARANRTALGGAEPYFDAQARAAYTHRLRDLQGVLEEAEEFNDLDRASRTRAEIAFLTDELRRGLGLGGRIRASGSPLERARVSVTLAIKGAVRAIGKNDARLGHYLATTIKTGTYCSHHPAPGLNVTWQV